MVENIVFDILADNQASSVNNSTVDYSQDIIEHMWHYVL